MLSKHTHLSQKSLALILSLILICSIASSVVTYVVAQSSLIPLTISGGVYPGATTYTIFSDNGLYFAKNQYGNLFSQGSLFVTVLTTCFGTGNVDIYLSEGNFNITTSIEWNVPNVRLHGSGQKTLLYLNNGIISVFDQPIINITQAGTIGYWVENLVLDGNRNNNAGGTGFFVGRNYDDATTDVPNIHGFRNVVVQFCDWTGIRLGKTSIGACLESQLISCWAFRNGGHGFDLEASDHKVINCVAAQNDYSGFEIGGTNNQLTNCKAYGNDYTGGQQGNGFTLEGTSSYGNQLLNCQAQDNLYNGFLLYNGAKQNLLSGCQAISNSFDHTGFYCGIKIDASNYNIITGFISNDQSNPHVQAYGVYEINSDYNIITSGFGYNNTVFGIYTTGVNTKVNLCYNTTVWIP